MEKTFRAKNPSKILGVIVLLILGAFLIVLAGVAFSPNVGFIDRIISSLSALLILTIVIYSIYASKSLRYILTKDHLLITEKLFVNRKIPIQHIYKVEQTRSYLNTSTATSYDRLEVFYENFSSVMISPEKEEDFIRELLLRNSKIEVIKTRTKH